MCLGQFRALGIQQKTKQAKSLFFWSAHNFEGREPKSNKLKPARRQNPRPFCMLQSSAWVISLWGQKRTRGETHTHTHIQRTSPNWASPVNQASRKYKARWKRLPEHSNALFQSLNWKCVHLVWVPVNPKAGGSQTIDSPETTPIRAQAWKPALHQKAWGLEKLKGLGPWLLEMAKQDGSICLPTWQQLSLAWNECLHWPREAGSHLGWREAAASQHQHGASRQAALAETKRDGGKSCGCPASGLLSKNWEQCCANGRSDLFQNLGHLVWDAIWVISWCLFSA